MKPAARLYDLREKRVKLDKWLMTKEKVQQAFIITTITSSFEQYGRMLL